VLAFVDTDYADTPYDVWARAYGVNLHLLVNAPKFPQYEHIPGARSFSPYAGAPELERAALDVASHASLRAILARMEGDLLRAARLRELVGVPGQDFASAMAFRDKVLMKTLLRAAGVEVPRFAEIRVALDLLGFVRDHGYPVVVKPALGSGSMGTRVLRDEDDLANLLRTGLPDRIEVEQFVEGRMYVVDGLVVGGETVAMFVSRYLNDCLSFHTGGYLGSVQLTRDDPMVDRLAAYAARVLEVLPTPECTTFHLEVWHTPDDALVLCEIASRTGGALTTAAISAACGFDLDREWFAAQVADERDAARRLPGVAAGHTAGWVLFYPRVGTLAALPSGPLDFVVEERHRARVGQRYNGGEKSGMYASAYVVTGRDAGEVARRADELAEWYATNVRWEG
jgi:biotin carboxylase